jgi:hypothetical protein
MSFSVVQKTTLGWSRMAALAEQLQELHPAHHRHVPVEQDDVGHLGFAAVSASRPSPASSTSNSSVSRMCRATLRITLLSSTIKQLFMLAFPASASLVSKRDKGNEELKPRFASRAAAISAAMSTSSSGPSSVSTMPSDDALPAGAHRGADRRRIGQGLDHVFDASTISA